MIADFQFVVELCTHRAVHFQRSQVLDTYGNTQYEIRAGLWVCINTHSQLAAVHGFGGWKEKVTLLITIRESKVHDNLTLFSS